MPTVPVLAIELNNILYWLVVGLVAGYLANMLMGRGKSGLVRDIVLGILGAFLGGWLAGILGIGFGGIVGEIVIATGGAVILVWVASKVL